MKLIIGQGNPGRDYNHTRHNMGFMMLDDLAQQHQATWQDKPRFKAVLAELQVGSEKVLLAKPTTFYNLTGTAARAICDFFKLDPQDILAIYDELDLPFGTIRTRTSGSDAGNNGVKSLTAHLGGDFARIRVGIANERREHMDAADFVLSKLTADEQAQLPKITQHVLEFINDFIHQDREFAPTSSRI